MGRREGVRVGGHRKGGKGEKEADRGWCFALFKQSLWSSEHVDVVVAVVLPFTCTVYCFSETAD